MPGVSFVFPTDQGEPKKGLHFIEALTRKCELMGARRSGTLHIESALYESTREYRQGQFFHVMTSTDYPATCFVSTDNRELFTADLSFREFPGIMKHYFEPQKKLFIEGKGVKFELGDFLIHFVNIFMGHSASAKGVLIEVVYQSSFIPENCDNLIRSFVVQMFPEIRPDFPQFPKSPSISPSLPFEETLLGNRLQNHLLHCACRSMLQYMDHFNKFRRMA